jgi:hypothetical protein
VTAPSTPSRLSATVRANLDGAEVLSVRLSELHTDTSKLGDLSLSPLISRLDCAMARYPHPTFA